MQTIWFSPIVAAAVYLVVVLGLHWLGGVLSEKGDTSPDKHLPYTGGEWPIRAPESVGYQAFFRLALLFAILHVAVLVYSTLPSGESARRWAIVYIIGIGISAFVLTGREE
ncbi:MAG: hypothetical protein ACP5HS_05885 [Anaerolineae bacterium]